VPVPAGKFVGVGRRGARRVGGWTARCPGRRPGRTRSPRWRGPSRRCRRAGRELDLHPAGQAALEQDVSGAPVGSGFASSVILLPSRVVQPRHRCGRATASEAWYCGALGRVVRRRRWVARWGCRSGRTPRTAWCSPNRSGRCSCQGYWTAAARSRSPTTGSCRNGETVFGAGFADSPGTLLPKIVGLPAEPAAPEAWLAAGSWSIVALLKRKVGQLS